MNTYHFVTVLNADGSIITCPKSSLKEEAYLFSKKKTILMNFSCFDSLDFQAKNLAQLIHCVYVLLDDKSRKKFIKNIDKNKFDPSVKWDYNIYTYDIVACL